MSHFKIMNKHCFLFQIPLSTRFMLLERGYLLVRDENPSYDSELKVFGGEAAAEVPTLIKQE